MKGPCACGVLSFLFYTQLVYPETAAHTKSYDKHRCGRRHRPWHMSDSKLLVVKHADTKTGIVEKCGIVFCICVFYHQSLQTIIYTYTLTIFHHKQ